MTTAEELEIRRRSIAMLAPGTPAIGREDALVLLAELAELRRFVDRTSAQPEGVQPRSRRGAAPELPDGAGSRHPAAGGRP